MKKAATLYGETNGRCRQRIIRIETKAREKILSSWNII